jgi:succinoglycan biosynthesis transport protein ExoP
MQTGIFQFLSPIRRRWWIIAMIVLPICLITALLSILAPPQYDGFVTVTETRLNEESKVSIYPDLSQRIMDPETRINNLMQTIGSYTVFDKTLRDLINYGEWKPSSGSPEAIREEFKNRVEIEPVRGSEHIRVHFRADTQKEALKGIQRLYENFREHYIALNSQQSSQETEFIQKQLEDSKTQFVQAVDDLTSYKKANKAVSLQAETSNLVGMKSELMTRRNEAQRNLIMGQRGLQVYTSQFIAQKNKPMIIAAENTQLNPVYAQLQLSRASFEAQLVADSQTLGPNHPKMKERSKQLQAIIKQMAVIEKAGDVMKQIGESTQRNPQRMTAQESVDRAVAQNAMASATILKCNEQITDIDQKLDEIPSKEKELSVLETEFRARSNDIDLLNTRLTEAKIKQAKSTQLNITMVDSPFAPIILKKTWIKVALAFGLSFALSVGLVLILGQFDAGAYNPSQAENALGFPVIASLPRTRQAELPKTIDSPSPLSVAFQILSTNLMETRGRMQGPSLVVASAEPNSGRSSVAANLAVALARDGARVVLVDADLREPSLHRHFDVENRAGLVDILSGTANIEDVAMPTPVDRLLIVTAGKPPSNPVRLLRDENFERFIEQVSKATDFIIFDSPSGSTFADADVIAGGVQNVLLVHEAGSPATAAEMDFHRRLERLGVNIVGVALNKVRPEDCHGYISYKRAYEASLLGRELAGASVSRASTLDNGAERKKFGRPKPKPMPRPTIEDDDDEA